MTIGLCGCESDLLDDLRNKVDDEVNAASADTSGGDAISISSISWLGDNYSSASRTATITGATVGRNVISTSYQPYSWPRTTVKVSVDAICCLFYERGGQIVGGKFDWWRTGGQGSKGLENVHHGYNGHSMPSSGTPTYTMIVSVDGRQRSNIQRCTWR
jgi:hypothetical protein